MVDLAKRSAVQMNPRTDLEQPGPSVNIKATSLLPVDASYLVNRQEALQAAQRFLETLEQEKRGVLTISGLLGSGRARFLVHAAHMAWQAGRLVVKLHRPAEPETASRAALLQGEHDWQDLPGNLGDEVFQQTLQKLLARQAGQGLLLVVEDSAGLDFD